MQRTLVFATLFLPVAFSAAGQPASVLHIRIVLTGAEQQPTPVPRHTLLISDNPTTSPPRVIVTAADGTADIRLRPGNYTVESDQPVVFQGKAYQWTQMLDIAAGRDAVLELTTANAEIVNPATTPTAAAGLETDLSAVTRWQDSVVALWTPTAHASGFLIDANGLIATNQRVVGIATSAEVQLTPTVKVAAIVLAADTVRDVAVLWIDPTIAASLRVVPLGCAETAKPSVKTGQEIFTIGAPLRQEKGPAFGTVTGLKPHAIVSDLNLSTGSAGGPVFGVGGRVIGITSVDDGSARQREDTPIVRVEDVCEVVASAGKKMKDAAPPSGAHLPVEPSTAVPVDDLKEAARRRVGSLNPYQMASADFDIAFVTPVLTYGAEYLAQQSSERDRGRGARPQQVSQAVVRPLMDFANWSEYVGDFPPVLLVRVTPKLVEGFWTKVARGAAQTQGMVLPPLKHPKSGFLRLRAFCGDAEVTPIHPLKLEHRLSDTDAIFEGLYVFDPGALAPSCGTVRLELFSEKEPEKGDPRVVDPKIVQQVWQDFAPYRAAR